MKSNYVSSESFVRHIDYQAVSILQSVVEHLEESFNFSSESFIWHVISASSYVKPLHIKYYLTHILNGIHLHYLNARKHFLVKIYS